MIRNILAGVVGLIVGVAFNRCMVVLNTTLYPMPEGVTFEDPEGLDTYFAGLPLTAFLIVLVAHLGQSFFGALVASAISRNAPMVVAMIIGLLSLMGGILNMMMMPLPTWMWIEFPLYLLVAYGAARIVVARRQRISETA
ncbi:MAG: hypothetical protein MK108_10235 [Mariniblastus sp.]|nr:hypothetical protein [Mariniblastus sp.]